MKYSTTFHLLYNSLVIKIVDERSDKDLKLRSTINSLFFWHNVLINYSFHEFFENKTVFVIIGNY